MIISGDGVGGMQTVAVFSWYFGGGEVAVMLAEVENQ